MQKEEGKIREASYFFFQIYKEKEDVLSGKLYYPKSREEAEFQGLDNAILIMDAMMDEDNYPQRAVEKRTFAQKSDKDEALQSRFDGIRTAEEGFSWSEILSYEENSKKIYFSIHILYRQNASWQGKLQWRKESRMFRSVLELMCLIREAVEIEKNRKIR